MAPPDRCEKLEIKALGSFAISFLCPKIIPHVLETIEISKSGDIQIRNLRITG